MVSLNPTVRWISIKKWWLLFNMHLYWRLIIPLSLWGLRCLYRSLWTRFLWGLRCLYLSLWTWFCFIAYFELFSLQLPLLAEQKSRNSRLCRIFPTVSLLCLVLFVGSAYVAPHYREVCFHALWRYWSVGCCPYELSIGFLRCFVTNYHCGTKGCLGGQVSRCLEIPFKVMDL